MEIPLTVLIRCRSTTKDASFEKIHKRFPSRDSISLIHLTDSRREIANKALL